jgi:protein phosphatase
VLRFTVCGATHPGKVREHNEDHILVGRFVKNAGSLTLECAEDDDFLAAYGLLCAVADGVGGAAAGETASRLALLTLEREFYGSTKQDADILRASLESAAQAANASVVQMGSDSPLCRGMATTLSGVGLLGAQLWTFNAGDSRVYRYRDGLLKPLTVDDSVAADAVRRGSMTLAEAEQSPQRHILTNYLGNDKFRLAVQPGPALRPGDSVLVCSDGLYEMLDDETIAAMLQRCQQQEMPLAAQCATLIDLANAAGGVDNISLVLIQVSNE